LTRACASKPSPAATPDRKERLRPPPLGGAPAKSAADDDAIRAPPADALAAAPAKPASEKHRREGDASLAALRSQCDTAASRGDCVAVGRLVERITKMAPSEGARLAKQPRIATCLTTDALRAK